MPAGPNSPACYATSRPGVAATSSVADRWFPSSKRCPECGTVRGDLNLAERVFTCGCGHSADRDPQRGHQSSPLGPDPSRPSPIPGPPSRRPGHQRPPTGRR